MTNTGISTIALAGLVALRLWTWASHHHSRVTEIDAAGAELDVDGRGSTTMRGCTFELEACLREVEAREFQREGGGHYSVDVHGRGAPSFAIDRVSHLVIRAGLVPRIDLLD